MKVDYENAFPAWELFDMRVRQLIDEHRLTSIAELGGGANPLLSAEFMKTRGLSYYVLDVSAGELEKASDLYQKEIVNLEDPQLLHPRCYDLVFAQMTLEHIAKPDVFYNNALRLLNPGGWAYFFFACDTMLPTRVNKWLPESISQRLLEKWQPFRKQEHHGKFKAHYRWCHGPVPENIRRLRSTGFDIIRYTGFFGHSYYRRLPWLQRLEDLKTNWLLRHPRPAFCSYAQVLLQKPLIGSNSPNHS